MTHLAPFESPFSVLQKHQMRAKKKWSQNFLHDENFVTKLVNAADLKETDHVLEIGPGTGSITKQILQKNIVYTGIEKDPELAAILADDYKAAKHVEIVHQDILELDLSHIKNTKRLKIISNLPFQLTSPILGKFLPNYQRVDLCLFIMQKEVADRVVAKSGSKLYSHLSLFTQFYSEPTHVMHAPAHLFFPKPKVDSSVILLKLKKGPIDDAESFFKMTKQAFGQKRKMIRSSLSFPKEKIEVALEQIGCKSTARPEELGVDLWVKFYQLITRL